MGRGWHDVCLTIVWIDQQTRGLLVPGICGCGLWDSFADGRAGGIRQADLLCLPGGCSRLGGVGRLGTSRGGVPGQGLRFDLAASLSRLSALGSIRTSVGFETTKVMALAWLVR